ncbi:MAG: hypothetical protein ACK41O_27225, partial [Runella zeae]
VDQGGGERGGLNLSLYFLPPFCVSPLYLRPVPRFASKREKSESVHTRVCVCVCVCVWCRPE